MQRKAKDANSIRACPSCAAEHRKAGPYCSLRCYHLDAKGRPKPPGHGTKVSEATKGKPKPWNCGAANPNYGGAAQRSEAVKAKMAAAFAMRGSPWGEAERERHRQVMLGPANAMRGRAHTPESRALMSEAKSRQYRDGLIDTSKLPVSPVEMEIRECLQALGVPYEPQYQIPGVSYVYDLLLPAHSIIVEVQGDYWHCNPTKYSADAIVRHSDGVAVLARDIWTRDARKRVAAEAADYRVAYIWESDWRAGGLACLAEVLA